MVTVWWLRLACLALAVLTVPAAVGAQLGQLVSPGRLTKAHQDLEGLNRCQSCHETGRRVTAQKCLSCHAPIALRMREKRGVHRAVTEDCVTCHVEHMGVDAELRPFKVQGFDHGRDTRFALDGKHAAVAANCQACHKVRSFLTAKMECASCHVDVHKGTLGANCASCHPVSRPFKDATTAFDHSRAAFPLTGAHTTVACAQCHPKQQFKGIAFQSCASCHKDPHQPRFPGACARCHVTTETWRTRTVDHSRTAFPLEGKHQEVACASCHVRPALQVALRADKCSTCHTDLHRGAFAPKDCAACHNESGFAKAPFDHKTTRFPLTGAHATARCETCHVRSRARTAGTRPAPASVEFRGLRSECAACHQDPHRTELGATCETCHGATTFKLAAYNHQRPTAFFAGAHAPVGCALCHKPVAAATTAVAVGPAKMRPAPAGAAAWHVAYTKTGTACATCHADVHLGQVSAQCETCHAVSVAKFQLAATFLHDRTRYALTGAHATVACGKCHKPETAAFPAGRGTTVRLTGIGQQCISCHADVHQGQVGNACESCHTTAGFAVRKYTHRTRSHDAFFTGRHASATCVACHQASAPAPAGKKTALTFAIDASCVNCHRDVHRGELGADCARCHKP